MVSPILAAGTGYLLIFYCLASAITNRLSHSTRLSHYARSSHIANRIIGGSETTIEQFPYQLALEGAPYGRHVCGASVITTYWALTAAHCVYNKPLRSLAFRAGSTTRGRGGTRHPVSFYLYPDLYRSDTLDYDVAIVKVTVPFRIGPKVEPVLLPARAPRHGESAVVSGWGFLEKEQLRKPVELVSAEVYVFSWSECKKVYPNLTPRMMCAGAKSVDFCSGDSGGPLTRGTREQLGIVSWLYKCGDGLPGVYTNVSSVTDWIVESLRQYGVAPLIGPVSAEKGPSVIVFPDDSNN